VGDSVTVVRAARAVSSALAGVCFVALSVCAADAHARPWGPTVLSVRALGYRLARSPAPAALRVIPFPGTPDASPATQIIFSALHPSDLRSVSVMGLSSGEHDGRLELLPAGAGTAFVPSRRFTPGEAVVVDAQLGSTRASTESGAPAAQRLRFSFRVATPMGAIISGSQGHPREGSTRLSTTGHGPTQTFHSEPDLHPPVLKLTHNRDDTSGDIFLAPENSPQTGPMILNPRGQLIWFEPNGSGGDFAVQRYEGHPVLTWWQGKIVHGQVANPSEDVIADSSYRTVADVHAGYGYATDLHDFQLTHQGTAYLDSPVLTHANLKSVGGPAQATVVDYVVQEIDVKTGRVLWDWHALGHVPISDSYSPYSRHEQWYDFFHLNSIQQLPDGNLLLSARNTWAVYEISRQTGRVIWTLGGKESSFKMGQHTNFEWQHDARLQGSTLSVFDDAGYPPEERQSSAKFLRLDFQNRSVSLIHRYTHFPPVISGSGGSVQALPNGNVFVDWGNQPQFSEYTPGRRQIFNFRLPLGVGTYRAFRFPWVGRPDAPPSLAVSPKPGGHVTAYASWNGATQVTGWRILGGSTSRHLRPLGLTAPHRGFETHIDVPSEPPYFAVQALSRGGGVLGTSAVRADPPHLAIFGQSVFVPTEGGSAGLPVGCFAEAACRVQVTVVTRGSVLGRGGEETVPAGRARLVSVRISAGGQRELQQASHHSVKAQVNIRSGNGVSDTTSVRLIPYSAAGSGPHHPISRAGGAQIAALTAFSSSTGRVGILTACYAGSPCHLQETVGAGGLVIGRTARHVLLGSDELGYIPIQLNEAGQRMLSQAKGNRLTAHVTITAGARSRGAEIDLVRYG
jgi:hypothetical protein